MKIKILAFALFLSVLSGCEKTGTVPTLESFLTSGKWKMVSWKSEPAYPFRSGTSTVNVTDLMQYYKSAGDLCTIDQTYVFELGPESSGYRNGAFNFYRGSNACSKTMPELTGYWSLTEFAGNGPTLGLYKTVEDISKNSFAAAPRILEISPGRLIISDKYVITGSSTLYVWTRTFTHD